MLDKKSKLGKKTNRSSTRSPASAPLRPLLPCSFYAPTALTQSTRAS